jgi:hypothetical protein
VPLERLWGLFIYRLKGRLLKSEKDKDVLLRKLDDLKPGLFKDDGSIAFYRRTVRLEYVANLPMLNRLITEALAEESVDLPQRQERNITLKNLFKNEAGLYIDAISEIEGLVEKLPLLCLAVKSVNIASGKTSYRRVMQINALLTDATSLVTQLWEYQYGQSS